MDPELKKLTEVNMELLKENNRMLKKMRRTQKRSTFFKFLYWLVIIGIALGGFYFLQPYFQQVKVLYEQIVPGLQNIGEIGKSLPI